jgi:hypothetical protein
VQVGSNILGECSAFIFGVASVLNTEAACSYELLLPFYHTAWWHIADHGLNMTLALPSSYYKLGLSQQHVYLTETNLA